MKTLNYFVPLLLFMVVACNDNKPEGLLSEDTYIAVFSELLVINQISDSQLGSVNRAYLIENIYEKYNTTEEQFRISHEHYQKDPEKQVLRVDKVEDFITSERDTIQAKLRKHQNEMLDRERARADSLDAINQESDN